MSYAIIRNINYKQGQLPYAYRHNERMNSNYSNKEINKEKTKYNYSIKTPGTSYQKSFSDIKNEYNLKGQIKMVSNVMCELIITSDKDFFESIGPEETKRYFKTAYEFVANYQNLGEQYIVSAIVHMDEATPHMHIVYIPVVHKIDKKSGKMIDKIACSEYWKGKDSYKKLQDNFYNCVIKAGFNLERGKSKVNEHIPIEKLKIITNYQLEGMQKESLQKEKEIQTNDIDQIKTHYKKLIKKCNTLTSNYTKIKETTDKIFFNQAQTEVEKQILEKENEELKIKQEEVIEENNKLKEEIDKIFEYVNLFFDIPINRFKRLFKDFRDRMK